MAHHQNHLQWAQDAPSQKVYRNLGRTKRWDLHWDPKKSSVEIHMNFVSQEPRFEQLVEDTSARCFVELAHHDSGGFWEAVPGRWELGIVDFATRSGAVGNCTAVEYWKLTAVSHPQMLHHRLLEPGWEVEYS